MTDADLPPTPTTLISPSGPQPGRPGVPVWVAAVLALALVAALVAVGFLWHAEAKNKDAAADSQALVTAGREAQAAAEKIAVEMTTYDWQHVDQDFAWVRTAGTPHFQETYAKVSAPAIRLVRALKATAVGTVTGSGVDVTDATHVDVLLFVDQQITGPTAGTSQPDRSRLVLHMVDQDGSWLVDSVDLVGPANNG